MGFDLKEAFIIKAEEKLNIIQFPDSYRNCMMKNNGDYFECGDEDSDDYISFCLYPIADTSDMKRLKRTCNDVVLETLKARDNYGLSTEFIQIGDDGGAGIYFFKINPDRSVDDSIWYRAHEEQDDEARIVCAFSNKS